MKKSRFSIFLTILLSLLMLVGIVPYSALAADGARSSKTQPNYDDFRGNGMSADKNTGVMVYDDLKAYYKKSQSNVALSTSYRTVDVNKSTGKNLASNKSYTECPNLYADWAIYYDDDIEGNTVVVRYGLSMIESVQYTDREGNVTTGQSPIELTASYGDAAYNAGFEMVRDGAGRLRYTTRYYEEKGIIFYIINHSASERIGGEDDVDILLDYLDQGYGIVTLDYKSDPNATTPYIEQSLVAARALFNSSTNAALRGLSVKTSSDYIYFLPEGYRLERDVWYWDTSIWGVNGTMEKYLDTWNNKIAGTSYDTLKIGKVNSVEELIAVVTQKDGETPIEYKLCMNIVYPSKPIGGYEAPVYVQEGTNYTREQNIETSYTRGAYTGFALNGYACVQYDHPYWPFLYRSEYAFEGSGGNYGMSQSSENNARAAVRCARYYADALGYSDEYVGAAGISKATPGLSVLCIKNNKQLPQLAISGYDPSYFEGDIFENKKRVKSIVQPFMYYGDGTENEISSDCVVAYISSGNGIERLFGSGSYASYEKIPLVISGGTRDEYSCYNYWDAMVKWFTENTYTPFLPIVQLDQGHTFPVGYDEQFGYDRFTAMVDFFDVYLKPYDKRAPEILWITPQNGTVNLPTSGSWTVGPYTPYGWDQNSYYYGQTIQIRFLHAVDPKSVEQGVALRTAGGAAVEGHWEASQGDTLYTFVHDGLSAGMNYVIDVTTDVKGKNGVPLAEGRSVSFKTEGTYAAYPVADAYVSSAYPDAAYGGAETLRVNGTDMTLMSFSTETIADAEKLLLKATGTVDASVRLLVYALPDYRINEQTITYNTLTTSTAWKEKIALGEYTVSGSSVSLDVGALCEKDLGDYVTIAIVSGEKAIIGKPYSFELNFDSPKIGTELKDQDGTVIIAASGQVTDAGSAGVTLNKPSSTYLWRRTGAVSNGKIVKESTVADSQVFKVQTKVGEGQFVKFYNALTEDYLTEKDVGKTFRVTFDIRTCRTMDIEVGFAAAATGDGSAKSPSASAFLFYGPTYTEKVKGDTWTTVTCALTVSSEMVAKQAGLLSIKLLYPTETGSYTPYTYIDNIRVEESSPGITMPSKEGDRLNGYMLLSTNRGVAINAPISVTFEEAMDEATLDGGMIVINETTGDRVAGAWTAADGEGKTFLFTTEGLAAGARYRIDTTEAVKTRAGVACKRATVRTVVTEKGYGVKAQTATYVSMDQPADHFGLSATMALDARKVGVVSFSARAAKGSDSISLYLSADTAAATSVTVYVLSGYTPNASLCYDAIKSKMTSVSRMGSYPVTDGAVSINVSNLEKMNLGGTVTLALVADGTVTLASPVLLCRNDAYITLAAEDLPVEDKILNVAAITAAQVVLGDDIAIRYYVSLGRTQTDATMRFTVNGVEKTVTGQKVRYGEYSFLLDGIAPHQMGDEILAEVVLDGQVIAKKEGYSVAKNLENILADAQWDASVSTESLKVLRTLIADFLNYGYAAQTYEDYRVENDIRSGILGSPFMSPDENWNTQPTESRDAAVSFTSATYDVKTGRIGFRFTASDVTESNLKIVFGGQTYTLADFEKTADGYAVWSDPLTLSTYGHRFVAQMIRVSGGEETVVQTFAYGFCSYVYELREHSTPEAMLVKAIYHYSRSVKAFADAQ